MSETGDEKPSLKRREAKDHLHDDEPTRPALKLLKDNEGGLGTKNCVAGSHQSPSLFFPTVVNQMEPGTESKAPVVPNICCLLAPRL